MFGHMPEGYYQQLRIDDEKAKLEQLRDQFAIAALQLDLGYDVEMIVIAKKAYEMADAMLEARKEKK